MTVTKIIDIDHNNPFSVADARARGVVAVIHKATEGLTFTDPAYHQRKTAALAAGLLWGAYHFSSGDDGGRRPITSCRWKTARTPPFSWRWTANRPNTAT